MVFSPGAIIRLDERAVRRTHSLEIVESCWWRVVVLAVRVILLSIAVIAWPVCAAVVDLEVKQMPQ